ncbi:hypothetical protein SUGI_0548450 [Cryptomeria japonica]|nr:hypothetical protein SUGI_0548450 [Cryptomeria japonica]
MLLNKQRSTVNRSASGLEGEMMQNMVSDEDTAPQEHGQLSTADLQVEQSAVYRAEDDGRRAVERIQLGNIQIMVSDEEDPDSNGADQSTATDIRLEQYAVRNNSKYFIQVTVALVLVGGSFTVMLAVPGGVNEAGRAVMGHTIAFNIFLVANMLSFHASLAVSMIVATVSHISADTDYFVRISLWAAAVFFDLSFHAAAYVVVLSYQKWIVLCLGGEAIIALALLLLYRLFYQVCGKIRNNFLRLFFKGDQGIAA